MQWVLAIVLTQLQIMLYPDENMVHWTSAAGSATYPGQECKLRHLKYLFDNFLLVSKNVLASRVGMLADSTEALAGVVVEATRAFVDAWFPANGPSVPSAELCVRLNNELPFTHSVFSREERAGFGYPSGGSYNNDCFKILFSKVPIAFPGETQIMKMVLPALDKGVSVC